MSSSRLFGAELRIWGGCQAGKTYSSLSKTMRLELKGWPQSGLGVFRREPDGSEPVLSPRFRRRRCTREGKLHTRTQEFRHLPQLQHASRWSLGSSVLGQWERAGSPPLYLGHATPTCSAGQTLQSNTCSTIQGLGLWVVGLPGSSELRCSMRFWGCGRCRNTDMLELLPAFF